MTLANISRGMVLLLVAVSATVGSQLKAETLIATFDKGLPEGWSIVGDIKINDDRKNGNKGNGLCTSYKKDASNYLITAELEDSGSFHAQTSNTKSLGYVTFYRIDSDNKLGKKIVEFNTGNTTSGSISFKKYEYTLHSPQRIAISLNYSCVDDFTYNQAEISESPRLIVEGVESGSGFNFGGETPKYWTTTGCKAQKSYGGYGSYMAYVGLQNTNVLTTPPHLYAGESQTLRLEVANTDETDPLTVEYSHNLTGRNTIAVPSVLSDEYLTAIFGESYRSSKSG